MSSATDILTRQPTNLSISTNPSHEINLHESPIPEPGATECLIHVKATGICGSDVHFWKHGNIGSSVVGGELILGHESAGVVVKAGSEVKTLRVGESFWGRCFGRDFGDG